jgi:hypothetical protein
VVPDAEIARRAAAYFASIPVPAGGVLVPRATPAAQNDIAVMFVADLLVGGRPVRARGHGPVVIDRRNGAITAVGTGGQPAVLFDQYVRERAAVPPRAYADPPPATTPAPPLRKRPRGRPTRPLQPKGPVPKRPWPPPGKTPDDPDAGQPPTRRTR